MFSIKDISEYIVLLIAAFASHYNMTDAETYAYLNRYAETVRDDRIIFNRAGQNDSLLFLPYGNTTL